jgi:hypothetical protein
MRTFNLILPALVLAGPTATAGEGFSNRTGESLTLSVD